jgi:hypothetical protein
MRLPPYVRGQTRELQGGRRDAGSLRTLTPFSMNTGVRASIGA